MKNEKKHILSLTSTSVVFHNLQKVTKYNQNICEVEKCFFYRIFSPAHHAFGF